VIGLSGDGKRLASIMHAHGFGLAAYDPEPAVGIKFAEVCEIQSCHSLEELMTSVRSPRKLWVMPGAAACLEHLEPLLEIQDVVIDCSVIHYRNTVRRSKQLAEREIKLVDAGLSSNGTHCALMVGGEAQVIETLKPHFDAVSPQRWVHCGPSGSGHFVEQVRRRLEYAVAQTLYQSLAAVRMSGSFAVDLPMMAQVWQIGSADQAAVQELAVEFLNESNILSRIRSNDPQQLAGLRQQMTPALNLALALHFADQGSRLFQQQIAALLRVAQPKSG
jgi:6-phosphogluconate dehydrogenase